jgi:hypothetical protein
VDIVPGDLSPEVKWPGHEADHSSSSSAEVKSDWICSSAHPVSLHVLHIDNITFYQDTLAEAEMYSRTHCLHQLLQY